MNYQMEDQDDQSTQNEGVQQSNNQTSEEELRLAAEDQGGQQISLEGNTPDGEGQAAWNKQIDQQGQDPDNQGGSMASDGPVSENEAGRGSDLTDLDQQVEESDDDNDFSFDDDEESSLDHDERSGGSALEEDESGDLNDENTEESSLDQDERSGGSVL